jgi:nucleoside-diphosphate-sugar epimerase
MAEKRKRGARRISLVTGATSVIGRAVVRRLIERGDEVRVVVRQRPDGAATWKTLPSGVKPYVADLSESSEENSRALREACRGVNTIFHFASSAQGGGRSLNQSMQTNVVGTENLLLSFVEANPDPESRMRIIFSSSTAVYGYSRRGEIITEESETKPKTPYGESKLMAEQVIKAFAAANPRIGYIILRIGVMYGTGYHYGFEKLFSMLKEGRMRQIGNGENHLTMVNIDDVVDAVMLASESRAGSRVYNLTDGVQYTQKGLLKKASAFLGVEPPSSRVSYLLASLVSRSKGFDSPQFLFLTSDRIVSIDRARKELRFSPKRSLDVEGKAMADEFLKRNKRVHE